MAATSALDSLSEFGIHDLESPMTASRMWQAIVAAKAQKKSA